MLVISVFVVFIVAKSTHIFSLIMSLYLLKKSTVCHHIYIVHIQICSNEPKPTFVMPMYDIKQMGFFFLHYCDGACVHLTHFITCKEIFVSVHFATLP